MKNHHNNTVTQNQDAEMRNKSARVQDDSRGGPTKLIRERSNTMAHGKSRRGRPDGKRSF